MTELDPQFESLAQKIADRVDAIQRDRPLGYRAASPWYDTEAAAAHIGLSVKTMQAHRVNGTGPKFVKKGHKIVRYHVHEHLDVWLRDGDSK